MNYPTDNIEQNLKDLKEQPDKVWEAGLERKLRLYAQDHNLNPKPNLFFNLYLMTKKHMVIAAGGGVALMLVLVGTAAFLLLNYNRNLRNSNLTDAEKRAILTKIIQNNPQALVNNRNSTTAGDAASSYLAPSEADSSKMIAPYPMERNYNYRYSKTENRAGPAASSCKGYYLDNTSIYESYEYFSNTDSYYKYISRDNNNNLTGYNLSKNTNNSAEVINYMGGQYAVRQKYTYDPDLTRPTEDLVLPTPAPDAMEDSSSADSTASEPPVGQPIATDEVLIDEYFGNSADIIQVINENGIEYYVMEYSYGTDCSGESFDKRVATSMFYDDTNAPNRVITRSKVNSSNYEVVETSTYIDSVSEANLMNRSTSFVDIRTTDFTQVASSFNFEFNVEIRDIPNQEYNPEEETNKLKNFLRSKNYTVLWIDNPMSTLSSIYSNFVSLEDTSTSNYYSDRNYYPAGAAGDKLFKDMTYDESDGFVFPLLTTSFQVNNTANEYQIYEFINVDMFNIGTDINKIIVPQDNTITTPVTVRVNGESVNATLYEYTFDVSILSRETPMEDSLIAPDYNTTREVVFNYGNYMYKAYLPNDDTFNVNSLSFTALSLSNDSDLNKIYTEIDRINTTLQGSSSEPGKPVLY